MLSNLVKSILWFIFAVNLDKFKITNVRSKVINLNNNEVSYANYITYKNNLVMIKVSESASKKIVDMMKDEGFDAANDYVRVGVKSGGCSGLSYELKFDKEIGESDKVFEDNNIKIAVEKKSFLYLAGTILEFSGGLNGKGFVFNNPNAQRTCGCGESFSL